MLELINCKRTDKEYQYIRDKHYVPNHGTIGRQCHYKIKYKNNIVGIITGASAVFACKPRDTYFNINKDNRVDKIGKIICNTVFRLEENIPNLGTQILSMWRKQNALDWYVKYGVVPIGFETFIYGINRLGSMYKADNWVYCGETTGSTKYRPAGTGGLYSKHTRIKTNKKLIFCKKVTKSDMSLLNKYLNEECSVNIK